MPAETPSPDDKSSLVAAYDAKHLKHVTERLHLAEAMLYCVLKSVGREVRVPDHQYHSLSPSTTPKFVVTRDERTREYVLWAD